VREECNAHSARIAPHLKGAESLVADFVECHSGDRSSRDAVS